MTDPTFNYYGLFFESLFNGYIDFINDPMYCLLASTVYTPNQDTHQWLSDITGEIVASGYTAGGQEVTGISAAYTASGATKLLTVNGGNLNWPTFTVGTTNPHYGILYMAPADIGPTQCPLIGYLNFEADETPSDQAFYINWNASGIFAIQLPAAA